MTNIQVFKRHRGEWIARPSGGGDRNPGVNPRTAEWLKSDFAQRILNKSVER